VKKPNAAFANACAAETPSAWWERLQPPPPAAVLVLALFVAPVNAKPPEIDIQRDGRSFRATAHFVIDAPMAAVHAVITDYDHLVEIAPSIIESENRGNDGDGATRVYTLTRSCFGLWCREVRKLEAVSEYEQELIEARVIPEDSDLNSGFTRWFLQSENGGTRLHWSTEFEPGFTIPPIVGAWAIRRTVERESISIMAGIERLAQEREGREQEERVEQ
jgi:carbon monoxide dehydrogenase subunit G